MRWSYKTVHYELKKEGILGSSFLDEPEIELSLNQYGKAGWELVSLLETMDGLIAVFKQPLDLEIRSFSPPPDAAEKTPRSPRMEQEKTVVTQALAARKGHISLRGESDERDHHGSRAARSKAYDEVPEAMMLDDFEVVEEKVGNGESRSVKRVDIGSIRIE